jgi:hypothetical protein
VHVQCAGARALRPPQKSFFQGGWKRRILTLRRKPQGSIDASHFYECSWRDDLSPWRKTAVRTSAITMRPGWLAQAAFVFCATYASPIAFHPKLIRPCHRERSPSQERSEWPGEVEEPALSEAEGTPIQSSPRRREFSRWISTFMPLSRMNDDSIQHSPCPNTAPVPLVTPRIPLSPVVKNAEYSIAP